MTIQPNYGPNRPVRQKEIESSPSKKKKTFNPEREWEKVKQAWNGDKEAWARYAGVSLD